MFWVAPLLLAWCWPSTHKHLAPRQKRRLRRPRSRPRQRRRSRQRPRHPFLPRFRQHLPRPINLRTRLRNGSIANLNTRDSRSPSMGTMARNPIPIAIISVLAVFGFPVVIVAVIMFSSWARTRSLHRTVRMMVEKGQPVPPELLSSPAAAPVTVRPWYDLRRGIVLVSIGVGVIMFFGISAGWDNGVWALGLIPGLIGLGYLLAWRLAYRDEKALKQ